MGERTMKRLRGFSLVEVTLATALMSLALLLAVNFVTSTRSRAGTSQEQAFAVQKGISLLEEVRNFTQQVGDFAELDALDDGLNYNPVLTIQEGATPGHVASGNVSCANTPSGWKYARRLMIHPFAGLDIRDLRIVSAMVYREEQDGRHTLLADVGTVLRSTGEQAFPTTQTYDVYFLAVENIPGWWVYMSYIKPLMEVTVEDLQARNPGLNFRAHWITESSYGRNPHYMPYFNAKVDSYHDIDWVYFYPGRMPTGSAADEYYVPSQVKARINVDGTETNGYDAALNPYPYALADEYNHSMRYIDELRWFKLRCDAGLEDPSTPTWRILLEKMCTDPASFENAILINLHGELLPMPAMRNYSDAARDPANHPGIRAVTHPQYLRTPLDHDLKLRVYAWRDLTDDHLTFTDDVIDTVTVVLKNVDLSYNVNGASNPSLVLRRIYGGVDGSGGVPGTLYPDPSVPADLARMEVPIDPPSPLPKEMWAHVECVDPVPGDSHPGDTVITLHNTPVTCPLDVNGRGLNGNWYLYGLEYIPSSVEEAGDFSRDLTDTGNRPKNTARWVIEVPKEVLTDPFHAQAKVGEELADPIDGVTEVVNRLTIETRIGDDLSTGVMWPVEHEAENLSRTYAWWTDEVNDVPFTERSQFIGDPRHCPYADLKSPASPPDPNQVLSFPNHYNWWFDNFKDSSANVFSYWPGYSRTRIENDEGNNADGWSDYHWRIDVPRLLEVLRTALIQTDSVYTTLTGYSYFYMGIGNEIGYDSANGFPKGIPVSKKPFYGVSGQRTEQVMVPWANPSDGSSIGNGMKLVKRAAYDWSGYWWGKSWIGELYPDSDWTHWHDFGNLPTGTSNDTYIRVKREAVHEDLPIGTTFTYARRCMREEGSNSFFLVGTRSSTFYHQYSGANGSLTPVGEEIADNYAFPLPTSAYINRPFRIDWGGSSSWKSNPDFDFTTDFPHNSAQIVQTFYSHPWSAPDGKGSALVAVTDPTNTHSSFQVINGLSQTIESGSAFIARWSVLSLVHGFLTAGEPDTATKAAVRINQLPRVEIKQPTIITALDDPAYITVQWSTDFLRWDGEKYTQNYPDGFTDEGWLADIRYVLMYSNDNGETWYYMESDPSASPVQATPEHPPTGALSAYLLPDQDPNGDETFQWAVPSDLFPEGSYLIRVEAYRASKALHFSFHMEKIFIDR